MYFLGELENNAIQNNTILGEYHEASSLLHCFLILEVFLELSPRGFPGNSSQLHADMYKNLRQ